jgi:hypothetical protein
LAALGAVFVRRARRTWSGLQVIGRPRSARIRAQRTDGIEELAAVPNNGDAEVLEVLRCQARENRLVYVVLAECRLILLKARLRSQTTTSMMSPLPTVATHHGPAPRGCPLGAATFPRMPVRFEMLIPK